MTNEFVCDIIGVIKKKAFKMRLSELVQRGDYMKYCVWNNKGGVGKSFLTFCLSTEYALRHPDEIVVVADMCPQSNISEILLGGNGDGERNIAKLSDEGRTIAGYIKDRYRESKLEKLGTELSYVIPVNQYNKNIPSNLFLLPGDLELDLVSSVLVPRMETEPFKEAPTRAMSLLRDILTVYEKSVKDKKITCFIDCNPSFAVYTELAIFASDKLIIPCTGDFASLRGAKSVMKILFNIGEVSKESIFTIEEFYKKASRLKLSVPKPHLGIINKARTHKKEATVAFKAYSDEIESYFSNLSKEKDANGIDVFSQVYVKSMKDWNNIALVINHCGIPVSKLEAKKYELYDKEPQVAQSQIDAIIEEIAPMLNVL